MFGISTLILDAYAYRPRPQDKTQATPRRFGIIDFRLPPMPVFLSVPLARFLDLRSPQKRPSLPELIAAMH
jgi:hypothetical protein